MTGARVHLTRRALLDIAAIERFSIERWGEEVAQRYIEDLDAALQRLQHSPALLRELPDTSLRLRFYRVHEHYLVCDQVDDRVLVLAVRHGAMDLPRRIVELEPQLVLEAELMHERLRRSEGPP